MDIYKFLKVNQIISSMLIALPKLSPEELKECINNNAFLRNVYMMGIEDGLQKLMDVEPIKE